MSRIPESIRQALHTRGSIDAAAEVSRRVQFLADYCLTTATSGFVLGISGGQDSSLAGRLCQLAAAELRRRGAPAVFVAMRLPYRQQSDEADARLALDFIAPDETLDFDIAAGTDGLVEGYVRATGEAMRDFVKGNVKARMRMVAQYAVAGSRNLLVVGTDHAAEALTGFYTKFGDGGADITPLSGLSKRQGAALLQQLGAPPRLWEKAPTADLLDEEPGQTDESSLGVSYAQIDDYLEGKDVADEVAQRLESRYRSSEHKRRMPVGPDDQWWIRC